MNVKTKKIISNIFYPLFALGILLAIWAVISAVEKKPLVLPQLDIVFLELFSKLSTAQFWTSVGWTLLTTLEAFSLSVIFAFVFAIIGTAFEPFHKVISPICTVLRATPTMAVILLSVLWIDNKDCPLFIGFLIAFPLLYSLFRQAFISVDKDILEMAKVYKISKPQQLQSIYIPSVLPSVLNSMQSAISLTVKVVIAAEVIAYANDTIGFQMIMDKISFEVPSLLAWTLTAIILSFILEMLVGFFKWLAEVKYGYRV